MADIELVIKIPEEIYQKIKETSSVISGRRSGRTIDYTLFTAVNAGIPLPKEHGRLIDADALGEKLNRYTEAPYQYALTVFNDAPTIIEADKAESEE